MRIEVHIKQSDVQITDDEGNIVLDAKVEDYHVLLDTDTAIKAIKELIEQAKPLVE